MFQRARGALLDIARRQTRHDTRFLPLAGFEDPGDSGAAPGADPSDSTHDPARLAFWTEFHRQVDTLPGDQRTVFDLHYFADFPQSEIARLLDLSPKRVSRLWLAATASLARHLDGFDGRIT